jgi:uncharacterized protein (DUF433 family)
MAWCAIMNFTRITCDPRRMNGQPCIRNLRWTVRRVVEAVALYLNREDLRREYPQLARLPLLEGDFIFFWGWSSGILRDFNSSASKTACSGDLPSCGLSRSAGILPACF